MNETRQRFGDVATKLQAALALKDVFIQVVSSEQSGRLTKVTAKMSPSDIKWLIENTITIPKEIGSDSIRVVESDDGVVSIEVGLPFERWKDLSYHDVMFDVFYGSGKTKTEDMSLPVIFGKMSNGEIVTRDLARVTISPFDIFPNMTGKDVEWRNCHPRSCAVAASADRWPDGFRQVGVLEFAYLFARPEPFTRTSAIRPNGPQES